MANSGQVSLRRRVSNGLAHFLCVGAVILVKWAQRGFGVLSEERLAVQAHGPAVVKRRFGAKQMVQETLDTYRLVKPDLR